MSNVVHVGDRLIAFGKAKARHRKYVGILQVGQVSAYVGPEVRIFARALGQYSGVLEVPHANCVSCQCHRGAVGFFNICGTIAAGILGARHRKKNLLSLLYLARGSLFLVFIFLPVNTYTVLGFSAVLGLLWLSTVPLTSGIVAQVFGPRYMGTLFAIVFFSHQLGSFSGVFLGGYFYDLYGTYEASWWLAIALGAAASLIHWAIDDSPLVRPQPARSPA